MSLLSRKTGLRLLMCRTRKAHQRSLLRRVRLMLRRIEYRQQLYRLEERQEERDE